MSSDKKRFLVIDDDQEDIDLIQKLLEASGHEVMTSLSSVTAVQKISALKPDAVICKLRMPKIDGFELYKLVRENNIDVHFIITTSKQYEYDYKHAQKIGVDGYVIKPIDPKTFVNTVLEVLADKVVVQFWGIRGTLPVPGHKTKRYGGNTNCVTLSIGRKSFFIFDAGTGLKALSDHLMKKKPSAIVANLFISHPHWDHINGLPFFVPFYIKGNEFDLYGPKHPDFSLEKIIFSQMESVHFPVTTKEFGAKIRYHTLDEEEFQIGNIQVGAMHLVHPGRCLGYKIAYKNKIFCYITDNEIYLEDSPYYNKFDFQKLKRFVSGANLLVIDTTYTDEQYRSKINWGHSCLSRVLELADQAEVKLVSLYHHDVDQTDKDIDIKLEMARSWLKARQSKTLCFAPHEGEEITL